MGSRTVAKDQLLHFSHEHPLSLVHLQQPNHKNESSEDEDEEKEDFVEELCHGGRCGLCKEQIWSFHLCYYYCKSCHYSLHTFCAQLPKTKQNCPSDRGHTLTCHYYYFRDYLDVETGDDYEHDYECFVCKLECRNAGFYYCHDCGYCIDVICDTMSEQKIKHPSHPHQLERMFGHIASVCVACGNKHEGVFFQCTTCSTFRIHLDCALLPTKLLIQTSTNGTFNHSHPLTLTYFFPLDELRAKYYPVCRVCNQRFHFSLWNYRCDKCLYYVHVDCATSKTEPFMSIFLPAGLGKTFKNYKEDEHVNLLRCPFQDEGDNLLRRYMSNQKEVIGKQHDGEILNYSGHQHPLILFDKQTSVGRKMVSLHDPTKKVQLLCDGCVRPIMTVPFYTCCQYADEQCCFVLHEWCANLPSQIQDYAGHPEHTLVLFQKIPSKFFGVFDCEVCGLKSNGFAYGCATCNYYVDINCAFIPEEITHDAHPDHLLLKAKPSEILNYCKACNNQIYMEFSFKCTSCDFWIHVTCALLLPRVIKHKCDRHPLSLRYEPAENHIANYFCEICEDKLNPWRWFYHCTTCAQSMHTACMPLILQYEQAGYCYDFGGVYEFLNIKFGGTLEIKDHPHRLSFVQGVESDGDCSNSNCGEYFNELESGLIFKCLECEFALHYECVSSFAC
ncbi:putative chromatin regulator PHD family [Helianthus annuus]|nr:putative chromatin regulator PHD family [Helianthus annuus]